MFKYQLFCLGTLKLNTFSKKKFFRFYLTLGYSTIVICVDFNEKNAFISTYLSRTLLRIYYLLSGHYTISNYANIVNIYETAPLYSMHCH